MQKAMRDYCKENDFQNAADTLEANSKVYQMRVDSVADQAVKVHRRLVTGKEEPVDEADEDDARAKGSLPPWFQELEEEVRQQIQHMVEKADKETPADQTKALLVEQFELTDEQAGDIFESFRKEVKAKKSKKKKVC